jgi:hypothetical protein
MLRIPTIFLWKLKLLLSIMLMLGFFTHGYIRDA